MASGEIERASEAPVKPRLRGVSHQYAFVVAVVAGVVLVAEAETLRVAGAVGIYATSIAAMFGTSALYHRFTWSPVQRRRLRRLDHAMIYVLIAGTYTPFGVLALSGRARIAVLAAIWSGALAGILVAAAWLDRPKWVDALLALALGWAGIVLLPQLLETVGWTGVGLLLAGGVFYTVGSLVYAAGRPDPLPTVFGSHEVFHACVIVAAACQYASVAFFLVPEA